MRETNRYTGEDLKLFQNAKNWKNYCAKIITPFILGSVLEVGAGIGGTTSFLCDGTQTSWVCLEPDPNLYQILTDKINNGQLAKCCKSHKGTLADISKNMRFDTILYIDVLEHIIDDKQEILSALSLLKPGGKIIILGPAHQWLFSPLDKKVGHFRRYNKKSICSKIPKNLKCLRLCYLDSIGILASTANKLFLRRNIPTKSQLSIWDKFMVPCSKKLDQIIGFSFGKSILGIWQL